MIKKTTLIFLLAFFFAFLAPKISAVWAQDYKFQLLDPSKKITVGSPFGVKILINTGGEEILNGDVLFTYDPTFLNIDSASSGNFLAAFTYAPLGGTTNKYVVSSFEESIAHPKSTTTDKLFANLTLTALKTGTTQISFDCTNGGEDSNITRASDSEDIVQCPLTPLTITIGNGGGSPTTPPNPTNSPNPTTRPASTNTPVPTRTPTPTIDPATYTPTPTRVPTQPPVPTNTTVPTNTPVTAISELPRAGVASVTLGVIGIGSLLTFIGLLFIL